MQTTQPMPTVKLTPGAATVYSSRAFVQQDKDRKWAVLCLVLLLLLIALGLFAWWLIQPKGDTGSYVTARGEMTVEEARAMLDEQVDKSRITVSLSPKPKLRNDGSMRVNFLVEEPNNGLSERLEVEQDGVVVYRSGVVAPGNGIEWTSGSNAHAGEATATVYAVDENGADRGNPVSVEIEVAE